MIGTDGGEQATSGTDVSTDAAARVVGQSASLHTVDTELSQRAISRIVVSPNGVSSYHGRTSALFEDNVQEQRVADRAPRLPLELAQKVLISEAAQGSEYL